MQTADVFFVKYARIFDVFNSPKFLFGMFTYLEYFDVFKFFSNTRIILGQMSRI